MLHRVYLVSLLMLFAASACFARADSDSLKACAYTKYKSGDFADALNIYLELLGQASREKDDKGAAYAMYQVARMHYYLRNLTLSISTSREALEMARASHNDSVTAKALSFIGSLYQEIEKTDSSLVYYKQAQQQMEGTRDWGELSTLYGAMGELYLRQLHNDGEASRCFALCERYAVKADNITKLAFAVIKNSIYASYHGECQKGEQLAQKAWALYRQEKNVDGELYAMRAVVFARTQCGDTSIYRLVSDMQDAQDFLFRSKTADKIAYYKTLYETGKTNAENKELVAAARVKNIWLGSIIVFGMLLLLLLWVAYNRYRIKKESEFERQKSQLKSEQYKAMLEAEETERARIARELHDSLGQMLSATKMMLSVVSPAGADDREVLTKSMGLVDQAVNEVRTISHNLMPSSLAELGLAAAIRELARNVNTAGTVAVKLELGDELNIAKNAEVIVYRILQEIIHNALKHAAATQIFIKVERTAAGNFIQVKDNGRGFDTTTIEQSAGIGWKNIFLRVGLLAGAINVTSAPGSGTDIQITFR